MERYWTPRCKLAPVALLGVDLVAHRSGSHRELLETVDLSYVAILLHVSSSGGSPRLTRDTWAEA